MALYTVYILAGIACGLAAAYGAWLQLARRISERTRHTVALERNTEVTETLNDHIEKLNDKLDDHGQQIARLNYKVFGFDHAS